MRRVFTDIASGVAHVRLARPGKLNALDATMLEALVEAGEWLLRRRDVRCVVLSGEGPSFCAGIDASYFYSIEQGLGWGVNGPCGELPLRERTHGLANRPQRAATVWSDMPVPVIAAVNGHCYGGGLQVALGSDMRLTSADARWCVKEIHWGLVPDMGLYTLGPRLLRHDVLADLVFTGRELSGVEAVAVGLATRVDADPIEAALSLATQIATYSPDAIRASKRLLRISHASSPDVLMQESLEQDALVGSADQIEAIRANIEKRQARFHGM